MNSSRSDINTALRALDADIEKWSATLSQLEDNSKERRVIEVKLANWKQKREQVAALSIAKLKHDLKTGTSR